MIRTARTALAVLLPATALPIARNAASAQTGDARAPYARSERRATLPDSSFWPEGVDVDPRTGRIYVASVRHRTIAELSPDGTTRELWPRDRHDLGGLLGVRVDSARGVLWATTSGIPQSEGFVPGDTAIAALLRIRIADGVIEGRWNIPVIRGGHVLGDLAIGPQGDVFVTDSREPVLYRLRSGAAALEPIRSPLFRSLQGIAPNPDGRTLYLSDYANGLLRLDLAPMQTTRVENALAASRGCDGIVWDRGAIVAVQNGVSPARIVRFVLDASGTRLTETQLLSSDTTLAPEPTIGSIHQLQFIYVANSQWEEHDAAGNLLPGRVLTRPVLASVPLPP